jgi:Fe-S-cluster containining protein
MKKFNCKCCGDCCSGDMDIFLNHYDLYKIAAHLGMKSTRELFERKLVELKEGQKGLLLPKLLFKTHPYRFCPFLVNDLDEDNVLKGYCSLHPFTKPLVCILAPTSREYNTESIQ